MAEPVFRFRENASEDIKQELGLFLKKIDREYKNMLAQLNIASNIGFIGKKTESAVKISATEGGMQ